MTPTLWFICPAHGRLRLAAICLRQLHRTCHQLHQHGVQATAVVIADDPNLDTARRLGFGTIHRDNQFLSRKFNDGISLALDPRYNPRPADYIVPIGSDDFVDHRLFLDLPGPHTAVGFQRMSFVREDGQEITATHLDNQGGSGIRIYPRQLMEPLGYRPADEDRGRACDTSILTNLRRHWEDHLTVEHRHLHDRQIVDLKTADQQLNPYDTIRRRHRRDTTAPDPFGELAGIYPAQALKAMRNHYRLTRNTLRVAA